MTYAQVTYALADIKETLAIWVDAPEGDAYVAKLLRQWDDLMALKQKMEG
jgi:hypothetical protein